MCVSLCVDVCVGGDVWIPLIYCVHVLFRGSETVCRGLFAPCTMWVRGISIRLSDFGSKHFSWLSQITDPLPPFKITYVFFVFILASYHI